MQILSPSRFRLFFLTFLAGIALASVAYIIHVRQRVDALESENAKLRNEVLERQEREDFLRWENDALERERNFIKLNFMAFEQAIKKETTVDEKEREMSGRQRLYKSPK